MLFKKIKLPRKISPCPIHEAAIEMLFKPRVIDDAVFGMIYGLFQDKYTRVEKLPASQIPEDAINSDSPLAYEPHYRLFNEKFLLQIGPRIISLVNKNDYCGWDNFSKEIKSVFQKLNKSDIINKVERFGMRYVDYFKFDIFDKINIDITGGDKKLKCKRKYIKSDFVDQGTNITLHIANNLKIDDFYDNASVVDLDLAPSRIPKDPVEFFKGFGARLDQLHEQNKCVFFNLIKPEFLKELNPEY